MRKDIIIEEIHKDRDEYARQFNYDLHAICQDIRKKQGQGGRRVVSLSPRLIKRDKACTECVPILNETDTRLRQKSRTSRFA